ncbi:MAG: glycosyltransferase family 4 protein, partial [Muribaculaceae bacterium]|nr:glycosyltransferase family 4 protein [Muribaculaceae bacterium]
RHLVKAGKPKQLALYRAIDSLVFVSETARREFLKGAFPAEGINMDVIHNALPQSDFPQADTSHQPPLILYIGRLAAEKGADVLLDLFRRLDADLPGRMDLWRPGNVPYAEFCRLLDQADIVVDQLYSYTPATTALLAMARGAVAVTGGEDEFYRFIGEGERRPIFNPDPCDPEGTYSRLRELLDSPEALRRMSEDAPGFVRSHNSGDVVAARFERFWTR